jgi:squalene cyclase
MNASETPRENERRLMNDFAMRNQKIDEAVNYLIHKQDVENESKYYVYVGYHPIYGWWFVTDAEAQADREKLSCLKNACMVDRDGFVREIP